MKWYCSAALICLMVVAGCKYLPDIPIPIPTPTPEPESGIVTVTMVDTVEALAIAKRPRALLVGSILPDLKGVSVDWIVFDELNSPRTWQAWKPIVLAARDKYKGVKQGMLACGDQHPIYWRLLADGGQAGLIQWFLVDNESNRDLNAYLADLKKLALHYGPEQNKRYVVYAASSRFVPGHEAACIKAGAVGVAVK